MAKTIRIRDREFEFIRSHQREGERDQDTMARLLAEEKPPMPAQIKIDQNFINGITEALRPIIGKEVKNAIESATAR